jgi:D-3-phosphoglycerate dehydrogenase
MKIAILDDYQNATQSLKCFELLADHEVKVFNSTTRGWASWRSGWRPSMRWS